ncbi:hypothetical protein [Streptomyces sp. 5-10]|uniref:hypothetical protein n=1 Tax=Streptomyces sp. 5-10 TaxID=878925 RepID=UPI00168BAB13|nr:hypothetical protein [Streptomyces sp. 5-10]MBD3004606.1 hypothetical protein [Streptomyces sp. 5-10]
MFVLSAISPPEGEAKYGKARVCSPRERKPHVISQVSEILRKRDPRMSVKEADLYGLQIARAELGFVSVVASMGLRFRVDDINNKPHPCPCCDRLVVVTDHAYAYNEDALCLGCSTWNRNIPACLPENSAHATKEERE